MKTHKLQINTLNAITIGRTLIILTTLILLLLLLLLLLPLLPLLLLLPENFLTENCNKLSENPLCYPTTTTTAAAARDGIDQQQQSQTNCTRAATMVTTELITGSDSHRDMRCFAGGGGEEGGGEGGGEEGFNSSNVAVLLRYREMRPNGRRVAAVAANRAKRFIIYNGSGVVKLVLGTAYPVQLVDKMRSLSYFVNIQLQYMPPPRPIYWWSLYNSSTFPLRRQQRHVTLLRRDKSREFLYAAIEAIFERAGLPGAPCLLKAICEVARTPFYGGGGSGIFHALLNAIFTPALPNVSAKYLDARQAGHDGADCARLFKTCPPHRNWLASISHFV